jgi:hypothetical protein
MPRISKSAKWSRSWLDPTGGVAGVVIGVPASGTAGAKNVAVPMGDLGMSKGHLTLDRTNEQLQQANNYQLDAAGSPKPGGHSGKQ